MTDAERAAFGAELRFVACRFAVTRITDVHLKRDAGAAPGKNYQRYLDRLASVKKHLAAKDGLFESLRRALGERYFRTMLMYLRRVSLRSSSRST